MKQNKYLMEEYHRGEWQPLMRKTEDGTKIQRYVKITEEEAEIMNIYADVKKIRYVKSGSVTKSVSTPKKQTESNTDDIKTLRAAYKEKFRKNAFNGWSAEKLQEKLAE